MTATTLVTVAATLSASTLAFKDASANADNASTPFARSVLAAVVSGSSSLTFAESLVIASFGSPNSPRTGKPIAKVSGLRDVVGGARVYQAWKAIADTLANIDADAPAEHTNAATGDVTTVGDGAIRKAIVAFILNDDGAAKALFGATGIAAVVKGMAKDHAVAVMAAMGVVADDASDASDKGNASDNSDANANAAPVSLADRINATLVALQNADAAEFAAAAPALAALADYIDAITVADVDASDVAADDAELIAVNG